MLGETGLGIRASRVPAPRHAPVHGRRRGDLSLTILVGRGGPDNDYRIRPTLGLDSSSVHSNSVTRSF